MTTQKCTTAPNNADLLDGVSSSEHQNYIDSLASLAPATP